MDEIWVVIILADIKLEMSSQERVPNCHWHLRWGEWLRKSNERRSKDQIGIFRRMDFVLWKCWCLGKEKDSPPLGLGVGGKGKKTRNEFLFYGSDFTLNYVSNCTISNLTWSQTFLFAWWDCVNCSRIRLLSVRYMSEQWIDRGLGVVFTCPAASSVSVHQRGRLTSPACHQDAASQLALTTVKHHLDLLPCYPINSIPII